MTKSISEWMRIVHDNSVVHGFWDMGLKNRNKAEMIALMHSELSEALEAIRKPDMKDSHLPDQDPVGLELADTCIRIFDYCQAFGLPLEELISAKHEYNVKRPHKHGKIF